MNTRKKVIKTVYKDENDSAEETGDFSDSGSEAKISEESEESSEDEEEAHVPSSSDDFQNSTTIKKSSKPKTYGRKPKFAKAFVNKISKQSSGDQDDDVPPVFSVKDLTDEDKLLPSVLNLSESDSSDDEGPKVSSKNTSALSTFSQIQEDSENETQAEYKDVWSNNLPDNSEEVARQAFLELEQHKSKIDQTKAVVHSYTTKLEKDSNFDVNDLLARGEEAVSKKKIPVKKKVKSKRARDESDSEMEDWEEVQESKAIPQQGLQLIVELPDAVRRKTKTIDVEMMMKRKMNRVKKEYQVYMHKVHVLCWIGHGNYVSKVLNDQELLAASLSLVPGKECYPGERVDLKYLEQISTWYKDKLTLKQDRNENKFRPKAPPLKEILLGQIKSRVVTSKKYLVFIFVAMLRALGLQCRIMFNFVTLPLKPPSSELCSLSTKPKEENESKTKSKPIAKGDKNTAKTTSKKTNPKSKNTEKVAQLDGNYDSVEECDDYDSIMQIDGSDDAPPQTRNSRTRKAKNTTTTEEDVSPPKRTRKSPNPKPANTTKKGTKGTEASKLKVKTEDVEQTQVNTLKPKRNVKEKVADQNVKDRTLKANKLEPSPRKSRSSSKDTSSADKTTKIDAQKKPSNKQTKSKATGETDNNQSISVANLKPNADDKSTIKLEVSPRKTRSRSKDTTNSHKATELTEKKTSKNQKKEKESTAEPPKDATLKTNEDKNASSPRKTRSNKKDTCITDKAGNNDVQKKASNKQAKLEAPKIVITKASGKEDNESSKYFEDGSNSETKARTSRKRSQTTNPDKTQIAKESNVLRATKTRTKSAPGSSVEKSKYFDNSAESPAQNKRLRLSLKKSEDEQRVSHKDLAKKRTNTKNDVTGDLMNIIKGRVKAAKEESKRGIVKGKVVEVSDGDSDYLPEEQLKHDSEDDFKPCKISPKPSTSRNKIDRRVLSSDEDTPTNKIDVWCEVYVEELEQWIAVNVVKGKVHCAENLYSGATHPVCYVVGWDNNNYLKDLTRRYVPHWNTVTRRLRAEPGWWEAAVRAHAAPGSARGREEDEQLDRMQMEAPLPKSIAEYKNHPLYALQRHLLKFEAIYPADRAPLGFVRGEAVYPRACVYTCQSREKWLSREAKVVRLGEKAYKIVKARPKWDKLSNKIITDTGPLEIFGPWQVKDYEPPTAEGGVVPRNEYGNVELFKPTMLPIGTVHIKLPGLNKVAKALNIDCAPALTGFGFEGGWAHPVYDGFVVCKEFEDIITEAWVADQENMERKEQEKMETRVYGNWRRLIKGLLIRERLKLKYGFQDPTTSDDKKKPKGPRLVVTRK